MGTSGTFGGSKTGLVPSWVDESASSPVAPPDGDGNAVPAELVPSPYPPIPAVPPSSSLNTARRNFSIGARTLSEGAIKRGAGEYVSASGGARATARRMRDSQVVAGRIARFVHSFVNQGLANALRRFNLDDMVGDPAEDVFIALLDMLCPAGGSIDEAIARGAMLETIADFAAEGILNFDELSAGDLQEFFIGVVSRAIEGKILNEVGTKAVSVPADVAGVERLQSILFGFVNRCVRDGFETFRTDLGDLDQNAIDTFVDDLYVAALDLVATLGVGG